MPEKIWEIGASGWFYYKEICYDARSNKRKVLLLFLVTQLPKSAVCLELRNEGKLHVENCSAYAQTRVKKKVDKFRFRVRDCRAISLYSREHSINLDNPENFVQPNLGFNV